MEKKEAMKILKDFHDKSALFSVRTALETALPELAESEDEKIRKTLIEYFNAYPKDYYGELKKSHMLAWLEKQGQKPVDIKPHLPNGAIPYDRGFEEAQEYIFHRGFDVPWNDCDVFIDERYMTQTIANVLTWADEHPKQKPVEEQNLIKSAYKTHALSFINYLDSHLYEGKMCVSNGECEDIEDAFKNADWGKIGRYYNKFTQKPIEINIDKMVSEYANNKEKGNEGFGKPVSCMIRAYRQGLKDAIGKVVLKPSWSEEDEVGLGDALWAIEQAKTIAKDENDMGNFWYAERWLKSIKQRIGG